MQKFIITDKGKELMGRMIAATSTISFTKICTSDYDYSNAALEELTELQNVKQTVPVSKVSRTDAMTVEVLAAIDNNKLTDSYYVRALGLYAEDIDGNVILYGISIETENPDYMPSCGKTVSGISFRLKVKVGNSQSVTLEVSSSATPTIEQVEELEKKIDDLSKKCGTIEFSVVNGILTATYDDGVQEGSEEQ